VVDKERLAMRSPHTSTLVAVPSVMMMACMAFGGAFPTAVLRLWRGS
jgi:hypothetical protein